MAADKAIAAIGLSLSSLLLLGGGFKDANPLQIVAGGLVSAATVGYVKKSKPSLTDLGEAVSMLTDNLDDAWDAIAGLGNKGLKAVAVLEYLPPSYRTWAEDMLSEMQNQDWVGTVQKRSKFVIGATRSGKSTWQNYAICEFVKANPRGRLLICDVNYGKPDADGVVNTWMDLPIGRIVRIALPDVYQAIKETWDELQRRKEESQEFGKRKQSARSKGQEFNERLKFDRWFLTVDEAIATVGGFDRAIGAGASEEAMGWVGDILFEATAYGITADFLVQNAYTGETGFGRGKLQQMAFLVLGSSATDSEVLGKIPGLAGNAAKDWAEKARESRKHGRSCLIKMPGEDPEFAVKLIPQINTDELRIEIPEEIQTEIDPAKAWFKGALTAEVQDEINALAVRYVAQEIKSPWVQVLKLVGLDQNAKKRCPDEWQLVRNHWETLLKALEPAPATEALEDAKIPVSA